MRKLKPSKKWPHSEAAAKVIDSIIEEHNRMVDEIRQIKTKLRTNAHYKRV